MISVAEAPLRSGIIKSVIIRSKFPLDTAAKYSSPSDTDTTSYPSWIAEAVIASLVRRWSSAIRILFCIAFSLRFGLSINLTTSYRRVPTGDILLNYLPEINYCENSQRENFSVPLSSGRVISNSNPALGRVLAVTVPPCWATTLSAMAVRCRCRRFAGPTPSARAEFDGSPALCTPPGGKGACRAGRKGVRGRCTPTRRCEQGLGSRLRGLNEIN